MAAVVVPYVTGLLVDESSGEVVLAFAAVAAVAGVAVMGLPPGRKGMPIDEC
jgi:hypothetical protein